MTESSASWDRERELFLDRGPSAAVIFLHGERDTGAGCQAVLGHACALENDDFEEAAATLGATVMFPDAPLPGDRTEATLEGGDDWLPSRTR